MKSCTCCGTAKLEGEFYSRHNGLTAWCKECYRTKTRLWNEQFKTKEREAIWAQAVKVKRAMVKDAVFEAYGGYVCACCGESTKEFLTLDHIGNDGAEWRVALFGARNYAGYRTYAWLFKNKFPEGFQVLCMNCNFGKRMNSGVCPHTSAQEARPTPGAGCSSGMDGAVTAGVSPSMSDTQLCQAI